MGEGLEKRKKKKKKVGGRMQLNEWNPRELQEFNG